MSQTYAEFFRQCTGNDPYRYQQEIGDRPTMPTLIEAPTGVGKTEAAIIPFLYLWTIGGTVASTSAPRRLFIALPMRTLVTQTVERVRTWLINAGLDKEVDVHVLMGTGDLDLKAWRRDPDRRMIVVGTIDLIASKAVMRAYGAARSLYPIDAGWIWNDAHVVVDEVQLAPATTVTLRQVDGFRRDEHFGHAGLTFMSATLPRELIDTVDNAYPQESAIVRVDRGNVDESLSARLDARRVVQRMATDGSKPRDLADEILSKHREGQLTLVIVNSVRSSQEIHKALIGSKSDAEISLVHSRFRPVDRDPVVNRLTTIPPAGKIVVSTQVLEAGVDIDAAVLVTEAAPWPSLIQRAGRCNRRGQFADAELWWLGASKRHPYNASDVEAATEALDSIEGSAVSTRDLLDLPVETEPHSPLVLRRVDFEALFDTAPDLSGHDIDVTPYIRDTDDLDVTLCWTTWIGQQPPADLQLPTPRWQCSAPIGDARDLIRSGTRLWRFDPQSRRWVSPNRNEPMRPGETFIIAATDGGYDPVRGLDSSAKGPVPIEGQAMLDVDESPVTDSPQDDPTTFTGAWVPLKVHLDDARDEGQRLVDSLGHLPEPLAHDVVLAAAVHDIGKAHTIWQDALCATADEASSANVQRGRPWAKSPQTDSRLVYADGIKSFRHELAGALMLDDAWKDLIADAHDRDLVRYLVLAHHGKLRLQVRPDPKADSSASGLRDGSMFDAPGPDGAPRRGHVSLAEFGISSPDLTVEPSHDSSSEPRSWNDLVAGLIQRYGRFRLAYLEALVRIADWRASTRHTEGVPHA